MRRLCVWVGVPGCAGVCVYNWRSWRHTFCGLTVACVDFRSTFLAFSKKLSAVAAIIVLLFAAQPVPAPSRPLFARVSRCTGVRASCECFMNEFAFATCNFSLPARARARATRQMTMRQMPQPARWKLCPLPQVAVPVAHSIICCSSPPRPFYHPSPAAVTTCSDSWKKFLGQAKVKIICTVKRFSVNLTWLRLWNIK